MRIMGLDVGTKTVGVAISDELGIIAQPLTTVRRTNLKADLKALESLVTEHQVSKAIVGLPYNMNGSEGPRAEASRKFGAAIEEALAVPVEYWDERLTTVAAERALLEADVSRKDRRGVIDQVAAALILQTWLDSKRPRSYDDDEP
jgi:putative holliday junction resolvase